MDGWVDMMDRNMDRRKGRKGWWMDGTHEQWSTCEKQLEFMSDPWQKNK